MGGSLKLRLAVFEVYRLKTADIDRLLQQPGEIR